MGVLDAPLRSVASTLVGQFGRAFTLRRTATTHDPDTNSVTETHTNYTVTGIQEDYNAVERDGQVVRFGDYRVLLAAQDLSITPTPATDELRDGSTALTIVSVERIYSGEQVAAYRLQVRR